MTVKRGAMRGLILALWVAFATLAITAAMVGGTPPARLATFSAR